MPGTFSKHVLPNVGLKVMNTMVEKDINKHVKQIKAFRNLNTSSTDLFLGRKGHETTKKTRSRRRFVLNFVKRNLNETMQSFLLFNTVDYSNIRDTTHKNNSLIKQLTVLHSDF